MLKIDWNVSELERCESKILKERNRFDEIDKKRWRVWEND